jgi:hypothetical protein
VHTTALNTRSVTAISRFKDLMETATQTTFLIVMTRHGITNDFEAYGKLHYAKIE